MSDQRGKRRIAKAVANSDTDPPLHIEFDESGEPIGENLHRFKSDFNVYCRAHLPYWKEWKKMDAKYYNHVWDHMKDKWNIPDDVSEAKNRMKLKASIVHRKFRTTLNTEFVVPHINPKPHYNYMNMLKWDKFVAYCNTPEFLAKSAKAKDSAKKNTNRSRLGRKGYAGLQENWNEKWEQLVKKHPMLASMRNHRSKMYIMGRIPKGKTGEFKEITPKMQERLQRLVEIERKMTADGTLNVKGKDPLTELLGKKNWGRTRGKSTEGNKNKKKNDKLAVGDIEGLPSQTRKKVSVNLEAEYNSTQDMANTSFHASSSASGGSYDSLYDIKVATPCDLLLTHLGKSTRVAIGKVLPSKNVNIHGNSISKGYVKVQVDTVLPDFSTIHVPIETDEVETLGDARSSFIQWPCNAIKLHQTMSSHSSASSSQLDSPMPFHSTILNEPSMNDFSTGSCYRPQMEEPLASGHQLSSTSSFLKLLDEPMASLPPVRYSTSDWVQTAEQPMNGIDEIQKLLNRLAARPLEVQNIARGFTSRKNREDAITIFSPPGMYKYAWTDLVEFESLLLWCTNGWLDATIIHWWAMNLYLQANKRSGSKCAFLNPSLTRGGECEMNGDFVRAHIQEVKEIHEDKSIFVALYHQDGHWTLLVVHKTLEMGSIGYVLDSKSNVGHPSNYHLIPYLNEIFDLHLDNWTMVNCHQQVGGWECGYYIMKFMHDFVLVKQRTFPKTIWNDESNLTSKELDQIVVLSTSQFINFVVAPGDRQSHQ